MAYFIAITKISALIGLLLLITLPFFGLGYYRFKTRYCFFIRFIVFLIIAAPLIHAKLDEVFNPWHAGGNIDMLPIAIPFIAFKIFLPLSQFFTGVALRFGHMNERVQLIIKNKFIFFVFWISLVSLITAMLFFASGTLDFIYMKIKYAQCIYPITAYVCDVSDWASKYLLPWW